MTEKVLVTGGAGFIGSHLVERLAERGYEVTVFDSFDPYYDRALKERNLRAALVAGVRLIRGDVRDTATLRAAFADVKPDAVVHFAARAGVRPSFEVPQLYLDYNVTGTLNVLQACEEFGAGRLLFASSSSVYGSIAEPANEETTPCRPLSPYGATKVAGEALCSAFARSTSSSVTALRFFTVYGPRQRPDMAIARFTQMIAAGEELPVYGDGSSSRDYTYISDIISGVVSAFEAAFPGYTVLNLGRGLPLVLRDVIRLIELGLEKRAKLLYLPRQAGDPDTTCADVTNAGGALGYTPRVAPQEGIIRYTEWFMETHRERVRAR